MFSLDGFTWTTVASYHVKLEIEIFIFSGRDELESESRELYV